MPNIQIEHGIGIHVEPGTNLMTALREADAFLENPCSGKGTCGKCRVQLLSGDVSAITAEELQHLNPEELSAGIRLACMVRVQGDCMIRLLQKQREQLVLTEGTLPEFAHDLTDSYGIAVDIGTTTVALSLVERSSGRELAQSSAINPQTKYGLDVLTRISYEYEQGEKGIHQLQDCMVESLNELIAAVCEKATVPQTEVKEIVVAANCAMTHMLLGVDARPLGKAPYAPQFTEAQTLPAADIGLNLSEDAVLYCLPQVSAYIGGDIVAGACACQLEQQKETTMFIDIGTNGEIILVHDGILHSCSCAAGPALEGMNIRCGMRAANSAVEDVHIAEQVELKTIGDTPPEGLCGSGILAAVRELLKSGYLKKSGAFVTVDKQPQPEILRLDGTKREAVLCNEPELLVTQDDVRQVQLAKGAIRSGFEVLLKEAGIEMEQLEQVIIAGQFGAHLPVDSLVGIGLIPESLRSKLTYAGNSSKAGAYMALMSRSKRKEMEQLAQKINYIELAQTKDYERVFAESLSFPKG